jgi:hypothetical protein
MSLVSALPPIRKQVVVPLPQARAFDLFTRRLPEWWPLEHRSATVGAQSCHVEPRLGGRLYERTRDGAESPWGEFRVWEEPRRVVFSWRPGLPDAAATEIEVTFMAHGSETRVEIEHRDWERLGARASFVRGIVEGGWDPILERFVALSAGVPPARWIDEPGCIERT